MVHGWRLEGLAVLLQHGMDIVTAHTVEALLAQASADCGDFYDLFLREAVAVWREDTSQTAASVVHRASQPLECEQSMSSDEQTALELAKRRKHGEKEVVHCKVCGSDLTTQEGKQMRAADEPETQFRKCLKCKFKWKTED
jgi:DNA-directed RNA polymerase subunit M/transcription elongation factor TFIIS